MKSLFPEMDREISDNCKADRRERVQRARHYLKSRDLVWLINYLLEHGPQSEHVLMIEAMDENEKGFDVLLDLHALWVMRKLWRKPLGTHPGSGERSYLYGIRNVHNPKEYRETL